MVVGQSNVSAEREVAGREAYRGLFLDHAWSTSYSIVDGILRLRELRGSQWASNEDEAQELANDIPMELRYVEDLIRTVRESGALSRFADRFAQGMLTVGQVRLAFDAWPMSKRLGHLLDVRHKDFYGSTQHADPPLEDRDDRSLRNVKTLRRLMELLEKEQDHRWPSFRLLGRELRAEVSLIGDIDLRRRVSDDVEGQFRTHSPSFYGPDFGRNLMDRLSAAPEPRSHHHEGGLAKLTLEGNSLAVG